MLYRLLSATAQVFAKFPTNEWALQEATQVVPLIKTSLSKAASTNITHLQTHAYKAFAQIDLSTKPLLIKPAWQFTVSLWNMYDRSTLAASCNVQCLACVVGAALKKDIDGQSRKEEALEAVWEFITNIMCALSDHQLADLGSKGVYVQLCQLMALHNEMPADILKLVITGIRKFVEVSGVSTCASLMIQDVYSNLLHAVKKFPSDQVIQHHIWRLLDLYCERDRNACELLLTMDLLGVVVVLMQCERSCFSPIIQFLFHCCQKLGDFFITSCLKNHQLMKEICSRLSAAKTNSGDELQANQQLCDFVCLLCSECSPDMLPHVIQHDYVSAIEDYARKWPETCMLPVCNTIKGIIKKLPSNKCDQSIEEYSGIPFQTCLVSKSLFSDQNHHLFVVDMLTNPVVYTNPTLLEEIYVTFHRLLGISSSMQVANMCSVEFIMTYVSSFVRDIKSLPVLANKITFTTHFFVYLMKVKRAIKTLQECNFHKAVTDLIKSSKSYDLNVTAMGLLSCLVEKYKEFLHDVHPFLDSELPSIIIAKAEVMHGMAESRFGRCFSDILLDLTSCNCNEICLKLYYHSLVFQLLEQLNRNHHPTITSAIIQAIGNTVRAGDVIKKLVFDQRLYLQILSLMSRKIESCDTFLLPSIFWLLHTLAYSALSKRLLVEGGIIAGLQKTLEIYQNSYDVYYRALSLLVSFGSMSMINRRFTLTPKIVEEVAKILKRSSNRKLITYTARIFQRSGKTDDGSVRLREMEVGKYIKLALDYLPDLKWHGESVLERLNLHTVSIPRDCLQLPPPLKHTVGDWPPVYDVPPSILMLPLDEEYLTPNHPTAVDLNDIARSQLARLGLNPAMPLFRIGRVFGSSYGHCSNCVEHGESEELIFRPQSMTPQQYQHLIDNGWHRRGGVKMFRLARCHNTECCTWETRVQVSKFDHRTHKSYKRVLKKMPGKGQLTVETKPTHFCREAFNLYNDYHVQKHDKPVKSEYSYCEHVVNSPIANQIVDGVEFGTFHQLYRLDGKLVAVGVIDIVPKGIVSIYMWYSLSKEISKLSFGVYSILKEIELVKEMSKRNPNMQYYYLQGWNGNNKKLSYKANYTPEDFYCPCIVQDWVHSFDSVSQAKAKVLGKDKQYTRKEDAEMAVETVSIEGTGKHCEESMDVGGENTIEKLKLQPVDVSKLENEKLSESDTCDPPIACDAFPNDLQRYRKATGHSSVDISKVVVCLNHSQYMYLSELFQCASMDEGQREIMETRLGELIAALGPELCSQLVIDLKACECEETASSYS